jgi:uncharacterized protein YjbI with pentapeptide repeats
MAEISAHPTEPVSRRTGRSALPDWLSWSPRMLKLLQLHLRLLLIVLLIAGAALLITAAVTQMLIPGVVGFGLAFAACAIGGYVDRWTWTGIGPYRYKKAPDEEVQPGKTFWDLLQLLIVPGVLGLGAIWYSTQQQTAADRQKAREQAAQTLKVQQNTALSTYLDRMSDLLLNHSLLTARNGKHGVATVALARTVGILRTLDGPRNSTVIKFLADTNLFDVVRFSGADLSKVDLSGAELSGAWFEGAKLSGAHLNWADLTGAHLRHAMLGEATLQHANLSSDADLRDAFLSQSNLSHAALDGAQLQRADLDQAVLTGASLAGADLTGASLIGARLDGAHLGGTWLQGVDLTRASLNNVVWEGTQCPDGTNSSNNHTSPQSCLGHLTTGSHKRR